MAESAADLYSQTKKDPDKLPTEKTWETLLKSLIASSSTPIVFVIDALDECNKPDDYHRLLDFLNRLPQTSVGLHCLISSRPHVRVGGYFSVSVQMFDVVQPQTKEDMKRFVVDQIESKRENTRWQKSIFCTWHPALNKFDEALIVKTVNDNDLCTRLKLALCESAGGMYVVSPKS